MGDRSAAATATSDEADQRGGRGDDGGVGAAHARGVGRVALSVRDAVRRRARLALPVGQVVERDVGRNQHCAKPGTHGGPVSVRRNEAPQMGAEIKPPRQAWGGTEGGVHRSLEPEPDIAQFGPAALFWSGFTKVPA